MTSATKTNTRQITVQFATLSRVTTEWCSVIHAAGDYISTFFVTKLLHFGEDRNLSLYDNPLMNQLFDRWIHTMCDNITDEIYRKLERDRSIIYVCKICRDEVEKIKRECRREVRGHVMIAVGGRGVGESSPLAYETYILMNTINTKKTPSAKYFQEKTVWKRWVLILLYSDCIYHNLLGKVFHKQDGS